MNVSQSKAQSLVRSKKCNRCNQLDITDFSKCRNCGVAYSEAAFKQAKLGPQIGFWPLIVSLFIVLWMFQTPITNGVGYVATGGRQSNVVDDSLIKFASVTGNVDEKELKKAVQEERDRRAKLRQDKLNQIFHF
jgi:hypothetical protein